MRIKMPEFLSTLLHLTGKPGGKVNMLIRNIVCVLEGHPTASWKDPRTDVITCDSCTASWVEKRPTPKQRTRQRYIYN